MHLIDVDSPEVLKETLCVYIKEWGNLDVLSLEMLCSLPTIDPKDLIPHGKWIKIETTFDEEYAQCSNCGDEFGVPDCCSFEEYVPNVNYCPNCGAKMDKE